jgi:hypothetical protein
MKIKEAKYKSAMRRTRVLVREEEYGCDQCKKPINRGNLGPKGNRQYLQATVFQDRGTSNAANLEFCSWKCCLKGLAKVKSNYFVSFPYLHYDEEQKGIRAQDFFVAAKAFK